MHFSVLMSLYAKEHPDYLRESLESVFSQSLPPDEVVLMEDGPITEELQKVVSEYQSKYAALKVIPLPENGGLGKALNEGLKHCSKDLVIRMDTDDICYPRRFETQVRFMSEHPEVSVCSAWVEEFIDTPDNIVSTKVVPENNEEIIKFGKSRCPINHPAVIYRKKDVIKSGGYGPFPEDYYLWGRMIMHGFKFFNLQEPLLYFRSSKDVYRRRGGWKYFKAMSILQNELYRIGYLKRIELFRNMGIRMVVTLLPNTLRSLFYKSFLRKSK